MKANKHYYRKSVSKPFLSKTLLCCYFILIMTSCTGQAQKKEPFVSDSNKRLNEINDTINKPKISYKVNKQVDKYGNIIKYDSSYTFVYNGAERKEFSVLNTDSLFNNFNSDPFKLFYEKNKWMIDKDLFFNDELFDNSFFEKQMQQNNNFLHQFLNKRDTTELFYLRNKAPINIKKI